MNVTPQSVPPVIARPHASLTRTATFMLVDDHPVVSFALRHLLQSQPGWTVTHHEPTPERASTVLESHRVDCVVVDLLFPAQSGMDFLCWLRHHHPRVVSVVYSVQPEHVYARRCLEAGATAYVSKDASVDVLLETVRLALAGKMAISGRVLHDIRRIETPDSTRDVSSAPNVQRLSIRELEVLQLIGLGYSNRRIAETLCRSSKTIESHRYRLSRKLGIPNGPELLHFAVQHRQATDWTPVTPAAPRSQE